MHFSVDWMDGWGNDPRFKIHGVESPKWAPVDAPVWEQKGGLHRHHDGIWVHYFYNDMSGRPTHGFGGAIFQGTFRDGTPFKYVGAWSSRPGCINRDWPDSRIVGAVTDKRIASAVTADALIEWWRVAKPDFGLAWVTEKSGEVYLLPTRDGKLKNEPYEGSTVLHLER